MHLSLHMPCTLISCTCHSTFSSRTLRSRTYPLPPALLRLLDLLLALLLALLRLLVRLRHRLAGLPLLLPRLDRHRQVVHATALGRLGHRPLRLRPVVCSVADFVSVFVLVLKASWSWS